MQCVLSGSSFADSQPEPQGCIAQRCYLKNRLSCHPTFGNVGSFFHKTFPPALDEVGDTPNCIIWKTDHLLASLGDTPWRRNLKPPKKETVHFPSQCRPISLASKPSFRIRIKGWPNRGTQPFPSFFPCPK